GSRQAKHGCFARESGQGERGWLARHAAHPRERPACCAEPDRAAALTERKAISGRQGAASIRSRPGPSNNRVRSRLDGEKEQKNGRPREGPAAAFKPP